MKKGKTTILTLGLLALISYENAFAQQPISTESQPTAIVEEAFNFNNSLDLLKKNYDSYCQRIKNEEPFTHSWKRTEFLETVLKPAFKNVSGIDSITTDNYDDILGKYFANEGKFIQVFYNVTGKLDSESKYKHSYNCIVGNIVAKENTRVNITNKKLADIVGDSMPWNVIYFTPETEDYFGTTGKKNKVNMWMDPDNGTAYLNINKYPQELDAHELMHLHQLETGSMERFSNEYNELEAIAFELAFSKSRASIRSIVCTINDNNPNSQYYDPGEFLESFLNDKGYTLSNIYEMTIDEREKFGIEILKLAKEHREEVFNLYSE